MTQHSTAALPPHISCATTADEQSKQLLAQSLIPFALARLESNPTGIQASTQKIGFDQFFTEGLAK